MIAGKESVFIISDMMPVTEKYIARPFVIGNTEYIVKNNNLNRRLKSKAVRYIRLIEQHKLSDRNHILEIKDKLFK